MNRRSGIQSSWLLLGFAVGCAGTPGLCAAQAQLAPTQAPKPSVADRGDDAGKTRAESLFEEGLRLADANRTDAAIELFSGLTRDYPRLPQPFVQLAALQARRGDLQAALTAMQAALRLQTDPASLQEQLGDLYVELASRAYQSALEAEQPTASARKKYSTVQALRSAPAAQ